MADSFLKMPKDWDHITLEPGGDFILSVESGGTPDTKDDSNWDGDIPWLSPREITRLSHTIYVADTERYLTEKALKNSGAKLMPIQTVMLTKRAPVGAVVINKVPMATNQGFLNFRCGPKLRPAYLAYWLRGNKKYLDAVANGSTYPELYKGDLFEFKMAVPSIKEQDAIIEVLDSFAKLKLLNLILDEPQMAGDSASKGFSLRLEDDLMIALLSGELRPGSKKVPR